MLLCAGRDFYNIEGGTHRKFTVIKEILLRNLDQQRTQLFRVFVTHNNYDNLFFYTLYILKASSRKPEFGLPSETFKM